MALPHGQLFKETRFYSIFETVLRTNNLLINLNIKNILVMPGFFWPGFVDFGCDKVRTASIRKSEAAH
ncbi:hypothetical protein [Burkholderia sp. Ac-20344]|uniref:hypothetical protein n=1 Tax=Burkholderia sp. Ac-20344 TaxID=2703890 RepID=UPI00197BC8C4|nr:hypothetical protein [Burkholderia sp. Ac-20344]MBN3831986.1 hypothetical protein [Burkholderia sp. Ac-20344]